MFSLVAVLNGCTGPGQLHDPSSLQSESVDGSAPEVRFEIGDRMVQGQAILAVASDHEQVAQTLELELESSVDGPLWFGNPSAMGQLKIVVPLSFGDHLLTLRVYDGAGNEGRDGVEVSVGAPNADPVCTVISPASGSRFASGEPVPFVGLSSDADGDSVRLSWSSDLYGAIFMGEAFSPVLPDGLHNIQMRGSDGQGGECAVMFAIFIGL